MYILINEQPELNTPHAQPTTHIVGDSDVGSTQQQQRAAIGVTSGGGDVQRRVAVVVLCACVSADRQQHV